jgi:hypothetical protein
MEQGVSHSSFVVSGRILQDAKIATHGDAAFIIRRPSEGSGMSEPVVEQGYCQCGCGTWVGFWEKTHRGQGQIKGQPRRFVHGHNATLKGYSGLDYTVEDRGFKTPCWVWQRSKKASGHGQLRVGKRIVLAHRHYYEQETGPIPEGAQLLQLCGLRACVNPDHQEPVSYTERVRRSGATKLTKEEVENIRREAQGTGYYEKVRIAKKHGISIQYLYLILQERHWAD